MMLAEVLLPKKIRDRIERTDAGCWIWTSGRDIHGYGTVKEGRRTRGTHRVVFELLRGPIPDGLQLDHLCRVRACVNPEHLDPVTQSENLRRIPPRTHCRHGHALDEANARMGKDGKRACRACNREAVRRYQDRRRGVFPAVAS